MRKRGAKKRLIRLLLFLFGFGLIIFFGVKNIHKNTSSNLVHPIPKQIVDSLKIQQLSKLGNVVQVALQGTHGDYGIMVKNLKTGEQYAINEHKTFKSGSLYKLWVMAEAYDQVQQGKLNLDEDLSEDVEVLNDKFRISTDDAELTDGTITLNVADALEQMITISHNYAALLLTETLELSQIKNFLKQNNFNESTVGINGDLPTTTASDMENFLEKLYKGELANQEYTQKMLDLLKRQQLNDKLPKYLPDETTIAHKTGELDNDTHDAGIVYTSKGEYIIVVLSESDSPDVADDRIAQISKAVYEYFTKT